MAQGLPQEVATHLRNSPAADASGALTDNWQTLAVRTGRLRRQSSGGESVVGETVQSTSGMEFVMPPYSLGDRDANKVLPKDRIVISGVTYDVIGSDDTRTGALCIVVSLVQVNVDAVSGGA